MNLQEGIAIDRRLSGALSPEGSIDCSIVIAVFNESGNVASLMKHLKELEEARPDKKFEFILVDDGSSDGTGTILQENLLSEAFNVVSLEYNVGQVEALSAGVSLSRGAVVIVTDGDLQFDLMDSLRFLDLHDANKTELIASRRTVREESIVRRSLSFIFSLVLRYIFGFPFAEPGSNFRLLSRSLLERCRQLNGKIDFSIMLFAEYARSTDQILVTTFSRTFGRSSWNIKKLVGFYVSLIAYSRQFPIIVIFLNVFFITIFAALFVSGRLFNIFDSTYLTAPTSLVLSSVIVLYMSVMYAVLQNILIKIMGIGSFRVGRIINLGGGRD